MRIVFRTEGDHILGMGDVGKAIALADKFTGQLDEALFILSRGEEAVAAVKDRGYRLHTVDSLVMEREVLQAFRPDAIILHKLNNSPEYIKSLKELTGLIVTIDDAGEGAQYSDLRINVIFHAAEAITDPQYIALKSEFQEVHESRKTISNQVRELLITQGGGDTYGFTPMIIRALEQTICRPHFTVVMGPAFRHQTELAAAVSASTLDLTLVYNARNMAELMRDADLAITAGGLTMFELACVGTPSLVICAERFEMETAGRLEKAGAAVNLGFGGDMDYARLPEAVETLAADYDTRKLMSLRAKALIDGQGCERIIRLIRGRVEQAHTSSLRL